ncbi:MAG: hypothetical protein ACRESZ_18570, partial [Methylococcales bacterium]
ANALKPPSQQHLGAEGVAPSCLQPFLVEPGFAGFCLEQVDAQMADAGHDCRGLALADAA